MSRSPLSGATVVLGVTGGIAAYKAVEVLRRLVAEGAHVIVVPTAAALKFVGLPSFNALSPEPAKTSLYEDSDPSPHTSLGRRADLVVVAPATARLIGSYAAGISSDLLTATLIATRAPVLICPAMHTEMWENPAVRENIATLSRRGVEVLSPAVGPLAGGDSGEGRLPEPEEIVKRAAEVLSSARPPGDLAGLTVLVSAGGTREPIDPVRFVGNRSSGRQGHAIAEAAARRGAEVRIVTTSELPTPGGARVVRVETAAEMEAAVLKEAAEADLVVMAAAVADFRPASPAPRKLKKAAGPPEIVLEETNDILAELGTAKRPGQVIVGFAAETGAEELLSSARQKLSEKRADLIVGNDVAALGAGFETETNEVVIVTASRSQKIPLASKREIADAVLDAALGQRKSKEIRSK